MTSVPWFETGRDGADIGAIDSAPDDAETRAAFDLARTERDERDAEEARAQYRASGLPEIAADESIAPHLGSGEGVVAVRASVSVDRDGVGPDADAQTGPLYLTTRRLVLLADTPGSPVAVDLSLIEELALVGEQLVVSLRDGSGLGLNVAGPRLLRVQIAAALMGARG